MYVRSSLVEEMLNEDVVSTGLAVVLIKVVVADDELLELGNVAVMTTVVSSVVVSLVVTPVPVGM